MCGSVPNLAKHYSDIAYAICNGELLDFSPFTNTFKCCSKSHLLLLLLLSFM